MVFMCLLSTQVAAGPTLCRGLAFGRGLGCRWMAAGGPLSALPSDHLPTSRAPGKIRKSRTLGSQEPILSYEWWGRLLRCSCLAGLEQNSGLTCVKSAQTQSGG